MLISRFFSFLYCNYSLIRNHAWVFIFTTRSYYTTRDKHSYAHFLLSPDSAYTETLFVRYAFPKTVHLNPKCRFTKIKLKGTVSRDFRLLVFFMNQFPPSPWVYHYGRFEIFRKFAEIFAAQGLPPVSLTPVANAKIFNHESFNYLVWSPLGSRVNL